MSRLTDHDKRFGPITFGRCSDSWSPLRLVFSTGGGDDEHPQNHVTAYALGWVARVNTPRIAKPWRRWVDTSHYEWSRGPGAGYWDVCPREYGFSLSDGFLQVFLGPQTHDSETTKSWSKHLPWTQWRLHSETLFRPDGSAYWHKVASGSRRDTFAEWYEAKATCPASVFALEDYDGTKVSVTCLIEQRVYKMGEGWFKWLSLFLRDRISRSLSLDFSSEVGPDKGSWKGGMTGHGIEMLADETPRQAIERYCLQEHHSKNGAYRLKLDASA